MYYDQSGPISLQNRENSTQQASIDGAVLYPMPLTMGKLHDPFFEPLLRSTVQFGSRFKFVEDGFTRPASEYMSHSRRIRYASTPLNGMITKTLFDALRHCVEFVPLDEAKEMKRVGPHNSRVEDRSDRSGKLNRDLLNLVINKKKETFRVMRTKLEGNEVYLNQFILHNSDGSSKRYGDSVYADNQREYAPFPRL